MGPTLIFDKSTLESLNPDEAMWLDNFFLTNITPLFFIETLADLEKKARRSRRTPEQIVGSLAYKTPDMGSKANVHHMTLVASELSGRAIDMRYGRPIIGGGQPVQLEGKKGIIFKEGPEEEALRRWQNHEFLDVERNIAKVWRLTLARAGSDDAYREYQQWFAGRSKPRTLVDTKEMVDEFIDGRDQQTVLMLSMALAGVALDAGGRAWVSWQASGSPPVRKFAPYLVHVASVALFFNLTIAADLISRDRPSNKIDFAYLYYLPFCNVFTSGDHLHAKAVPLFLTNSQTFVEGPSLKADLAKLDSYFSGLPEEIKDRGVSSFAAYPPSDQQFVVTELWDKYLPRWREIQARKKGPMTKDVNEKIVEYINRIKDKSIPTDHDAGLDSDNLDHLMIQRNVYARKGKWKRFPPEVEQDSDS